MQGNDRGIHGIVWNWVQSARAMQGNECARLMQGNDGKYQGNAKGTFGSGCKVPGEWRGIPLECMVVGEKCQGNTLREGECKGMPGERTRGCKLQGECRGIQGNARGTYGSGCKVPGECRRMQGNARETYRSVNCQVNAGNAGECQGNIWEWVYSATGMQGIPG